jgi:hypothetical protein
MRVGNRPHNSTQLLETLFANVTKRNYELRITNYELRITNYELRIILIAGVRPIATNA